MLEKLVAVVGPTASGKTALAIRLAERFQGEIVSCDSMQIYRGMEIGTAKPTQQELDRVPHHLVGILDPKTVFSLADFVPMAQRCVAKILDKKKLHLLVGGTGLYVRALLNGSQFEETSRDKRIRMDLEREAALAGTAGLYAELQKLDAPAA